MNTNHLDITVGALQEDHAPVTLDEHNRTVAHRDLGQIEPTELDGITINRTKTGLDPFVPIRKERLIDPVSGAPSKSYGIWVQDEEAPEGWQGVGTVGENYLLLPNADVRRLALEIAEASPFDYQESRIFWDGARFAHIIDFKGIEEEITGGDAVGLSLITRTSYSQVWKYEAALMGKRFACDNGVLSGEFFARVAFKHWSGGGSERETWEDVVRQGLSVLEHGQGDLRSFAETLRILKTTRTTDEHLRAVWKRLERLGDGVLGRIMSRYVRHEEDTLYGLFNAGTNVFWHNQKMNAADFQNNDLFATKLLEYAFEYLN